MIGERPDWLQEEPMQKPLTTLQTVVTDRPQATLVEEIKADFLSKLAVELEGKMAVAEKRKKAGPFYLVYRKVGANLIHLFTLSVETIAQTRHVVEVMEYDENVYGEKLEQWLEGQKENQNGQE